MQRLLWKKNEHNCVRARDKYCEKRDLVEKILSWSSCKFLKFHHHHISTSCRRHSSSTLPLVSDEKQQKKSHDFSFFITRKKKVLRDLKEVTQKDIRTAVESNKMFEILHQVGKFIIHNKWGESKSWGTELFSTWVAQVANNGFWDIGIEDIWQISDI